MLCDVKKGWQSSARSIFELRQPYSALVFDVQCKRYLASTKKTWFIEFMYGVSRHEVQILATARRLWLAGDSFGRRGQFRGSHLPDLRPTYRIQTHGAAAYLTVVLRGRREVSKNAVFHRPIMIAGRWHHRRPATYPPVAVVTFATQNKAICICMTGAALTRHALYRYGHCKP